MPAIICSPLASILEPLPSTSQPVVATFAYMTLTHASCSPGWPPGTITISSSSPSYCCFFPSYSLTTTSFCSCTTAQCAQNTTSRTPSSAPLRIPYRLFTFQLGNNKPNRYQSHEQLPAQDPLARRIRRLVLLGLRVFFWRCCVRPNVMLGQTKVVTSASSDESVVTWLRGQRVTDTRPVGRSTRRGHASNVLLTPVSSGSWATGV
jgi:hypothetical protein